MSAPSKELILAVRSIFGMIGIIILGLVAIDKGFNGDIIRIAFYIIGILGGAEILGEYLIRRNNNVKPEG